MESLHINANNEMRLPEKLFTQYEHSLLPEIERIHHAQSSAYKNVYASVCLPSDSQILKQVQTLVAEKTKSALPMVIVIGIGGSSLGTKAVHEALHGIYYNDKKGCPSLYFAETVDAQELEDLLSLTQAVLEKKERILINVISKSGTTTETIALFELFLALVKQYYPTTWNDFFVITTDNDSPLWHFGQRHHIASLSIPKLVGGRYSVFSPVGLFPLALLGTDIQALQAGARAMAAQCTRSNMQDNPAALSASCIAEQYKRGIYIHDLFLFSTELRSIGNWYRQLLAESLGKTTASGHRKGIVPTVSIGSTDLHSVGQLYLGGPSYSSTTFITIAKENKNCVLPHYQEFETLVAHIQTKPISSLMKAITAGVIHTYDSQNIPYMLITLPEKNEYFLGQLLQLKMIEVMYLGYLLEVNPFDQPHVERYKIETRKILAHE